MMVVGYRRPMIVADALSRVVMVGCLSTQELLLHITDFHVQKHQALMQDPADEPLMI